MAKFIQDNEKSEKIQVRLTKGQNEKLEEMAKRLNMSKSELVRSLIVAQILKEE